MKNTIINASTDNISAKVGQAMEDLALKGALQRQAKEQRQKENEARAAQQEIDDELEAIRRQRIERMKAEVKEKDKASHGELTTITQDEFLDTVLKSARVVCHFFHPGFEKCLVMDKHLGVICVKHPETRFIRIDAEKAPFFVERLSIRTLPTLACFEDGKLINKQIGFQGIGKGEACESGDLERVLVEMTMIQGASSTASSGGRERRNKVGGGGLTSRHKKYEGEEQGDDDDDDW